METIDYDEIEKNMIDLIWFNEETNAAILVGDMYSYFDNEKKFRDYWLSYSKSWRPNIDKLNA